MAQRKITDPVKKAVVQALACYDTPTQVAAMVKEEFGLELPLQNIIAYNPEKHAAKDLSQKWKTIFYKTRENFVKDISTIPIAQQSFRLRELQKLHKKVSEQGNTVLAAQFLEQASKEVGGIFTNRSSVDMGVTTVTIVGGLPDGD